MYKLFINGDIGLVVCKKQIPQFVLSLKLVPDSSDFAQHALKIIQVQGVKAEALKGQRLKDKDSRPEDLGILNWQRILIELAEAYARASGIKKVCWQSYDNNEYRIATPLERQLAEPKVLKMDERLKITYDILPELFGYQKDSTTGDWSKNLDTIN